MKESVENNKTKEPSPCLENVKEVIIPEEGVGPIYHVYEGGAPEVTEASVVVTLTIDENGNIAG